MVWLAIGAAWLACSAVSYGVFRKLTISRNIELKSDGAEIARYSLGEMLFCAFLSLFGPYALPLAAVIAVIFYLDLWFPGWLDRESRW